jgi:CRP/FNR family cyclic AMP-dependent transcriptional regulator
VSERPAINETVSDLVSVLDVDPGLAELVPPDQRQQARQATSATLVTYPSGPWRAPDANQPTRGGYGLLVLDGLLLRRVEIAGRHAAELLGPGDLLRPFQYNGDESTLDLTWSWRVVAPTKCAVLDPRWTARAAAWPQIGAELAGRGLGRSLRLVITMAIAQQPKLDIRLWMLFWELADRYGKVHPDGIHLDLPLTHEVLSHLAGARRPSVSGALTRLADDGRLMRSGRNWVLSGERPVLEPSGV